MVPSGPLSIPASPLERALRPGETVRFEAHAHGPAPLTVAATVVYAQLLGFASLPELIRMRPDVTLGSWEVPLPIPLIALALIAVFELVRVAKFRSRLYVVTDQRVLMLDGILRVKLRFELAASSVESVQVRGGTPAFTGRSGFTLAGLDSVDAESIAHALGDVPLLPAREASFVGRHAKAIALAAALLWLPFVEVESVIQERAHAEFLVVSRAAQSAYNAAYCTWVRDVVRSRPDSVPNISGDSRLTNMGLWENVHCSYTCRGAMPGDGLAVELRCERPLSLLPGKPRVLVLEPEVRNENAAFFVELKKELDAAGIEATWLTSTR